MLLRVDWLPNAVGKQPSITLINLGRRKWTLSWWWWWITWKSDPLEKNCSIFTLIYSTCQRSARAGFCRPGPARRPHGPGPARPGPSPGPARGPEFEFRARPVSARGMAKPGPARPGPGPVGSDPTKQFPWDFLKLFNLIKQSLFNGFVGYLFVTDAPPRLNSHMYMQEIYRLTLEKLLL